VKARFALRGNARKDPTASGLPMLFDEILAVNEILVGTVDPSVVTAGHGA
jgi:hypothetical protein